LVVHNPEYITPADRMMWAHLVLAAQDQTGTTTVLTITIEVLTAKPE
jgi:hypothetical protein